MNADDKADPIKRFGLVLSDRDREELRECLDRIDKAEREAWRQLKQGS